MRPALLFMSLAALAAAHVYRPSTLIRTMRVPANDPRAGFWHQRDQRRRRRDRRRGGR